MRFHGGWVGVSHIVPPVSFFNFELRFATLRGAGRTAPVAFAVVAKSSAHVFHFPHLGCVSVLLLVYEATSTDPFQLCCSLSLLISQRGPSFCVVFISEILVACLGNLS